MQANLLAGQLLKCLHFDEIVQYGVSHYYDERHH